MEMEIDFYVAWFQWLEARAAQLTQHDPLKLLALTGEVVALLKADVALWHSLSQALHGAGWQIPINLGEWIGKHPDPLQPTRESMRALRARYGEVAANAG